MIRLCSEHLERWSAEGILVLRGALTPEETSALRAWVDELEAWPETPGRWMKYFEPGPERRLCRVENFLADHAGLRSLLERPDLLESLAELFGEPARLFKEKVNYKLPGGQGFAPHQDAPAFASFGQEDHLTLMISVDPCNEANGGLEFVGGREPGRMLPQAPDGTLRRDVVDSLVWQPLATEAGDVVIFDSYVPHRSGPNRSASPRRVVYVTYNPASAGDHRAEYYALKRKSFPPEAEREPGWRPDSAGSAFNLGNPIR